MTWGSAAASHGDCSVTDWPKTFGLPPKRVCQAAYDSIAAAAPDGPSSLGRNSRPRIGVTPNVRKNPLVTLSPGTRSGPE